MKVYSRCPFFLFHIDGTLDQTSNEAIFDQFVG